MKNLLQLFFTVLIFLIFSCISTDKINDKIVINNIPFRYYKYSEGSKRQLSKVHEIYFKDEFLNKYSNIQKTALLINESTEELDIDKVDEYLTNFNCDLYAVTNNKNKQTFILYSIIKKEIHFDDLIGIWARDPNNTDGWYPGTFIFFKNNTYKYRSHYMDIYQQYFTGTFEFSKSNLFIKKLHDLWPKEKQRAVDKQSNEENYYGIDNKIIYKYDIYPIRKDENGRIIEIFIEYYFQNPSSLQKYYTSNTYKKISNDPNTVLKYEMDHLTR